MTPGQEYRVTVRVPAAEMPRVEGVRGPALAGFDVITVEEITPGGWWRRVPMCEVFGERTVNADDVGGVRFGARPSRRDMAERLREMEGRDAR